MKAHHKAYVRRWQSKYQGMKIVSEPKLRDFVENELRQGESPCNISGRIGAHEKHLPHISKESIYRFILSPYGRRIEAWRKKHQSKRHHRRPLAEQLKERTFIDKRPKYINTRMRIGDTEADFIVSGKSGKGIILTMADRRSRAPFLEKVLPVSIPNVHRGFLRIKERFPELKTITTDNDLLLKQHKELEKLLGVRIYFCHPYHSWEKGTIENINKYIRKDIPKGSNISKYSRRFIQTVEEKLQRKIYKCMKYKRPCEVLEIYRKRKKRHMRSS